MDFANERYVRLYTRDTTTWLLLGWEGQAILAPLLRKVDRSGVLDLGDRSVVDVVAAHLPGWPRAVVEVGLAAMVREGVVSVNGSALRWPKYLEAQECAKTDALRQREARERRSAEAGVTVTKCDATVTKCDATVTKRDEMSRAVTPRHSVSQRVTPSLPSLPSLPSQAKPFEECSHEAPREPSSPAIDPPIDHPIDHPPEVPRPWQTSRRLTKRPAHLTLATVATAGGDTFDRVAERAGLTRREVLEQWEAWADYEYPVGKGKTDWAGAWRTWLRIYKAKAARGGAAPVKPAGYQVRKTQEYLAPLNKQRAENLARLQEAKAAKAAKPGEAAQ